MNITSDPNVSIHPCVVIFYPSDKIQIEKVYQKELKEKEEEDEEDSSDEIFADQLKGELPKNPPKFKF